MDVVNELPRLTFYRGRVGLFAILKALGIGQGDRVATQAFTCLAVPEGIMATGATPLFVDTEKGGVNICPNDLAAKLDSSVKAVVVQHTFGIPAQLGPIRKLLEERGIPMIEDCCHTFASTYVNQLVGTFGVGAFYSFEWGKPIVAGIGGSAIVNDPELRKKVSDYYDTLDEPSWKRVLKVQLQYWAFEKLYRPETYWKVRSTFRKLSKAGAAEGNYNPTEGVAEDFHLKMAKPLHDRLVEKLNDAQAVVERANHLARQYAAGLPEGGFVRPLVPEGAVPVYARYPLFCLEKQRVLAKAEETGVEIADWYTTPVHPLGREEWHHVHLEPGSCPRAESLSDQIISLPINQKVKPADVEKTLRLMKEF